VSNALKIATSSGECGLKSPVASIPSTTVKYVGIKHYDIDGCDFSLNFEFSPNGLSKVTLSLVDDTKIGCGTMTADLLMGKYGRPEVDELDRKGSSDSRTRKWIRGPTLIRHFSSFYNVSPGVPIARNLVTIHYDRMDTPGASRL
jgi:hypothetical protein